MELNRTPNELDRNARNKENENWDKIEGEIRKVGNVVDDFIGTVTSEVVNELVDKAKLDWKEPVNNFNSLPTNAEVGETRMTKDNGNVYRYNGTDWEYIQQIDAGPVNELDSRLTSQLNETVEKVSDFNLYPQSPKPQKTGEITSGYKIVKKTEGQLDVVQKTNKGYVHHTFKQGQGQDDYDSNHELLRLINSTYSIGAYVYHDISNPTEGVLTESWVQANYGTLDRYLYGAKDRVDDERTLHSDRLSMSMYSIDESSKLSWEIGLGTSNKFNILFMSTAGSSNNVEVSVNDVAIRNLNLRAYTSNGSGTKTTLNPIEFEFPMKNNGSDNNKVKVSIENKGTGKILLCAINFYELLEYDGQAVTDFKVIGSDRQYLRPGANDYAIRDASNNTLFGSFHGGETSDVIQIAFNNDTYPTTVDSVKNVTFSNVENSSWCVLKNPYIYQRTRLANNQARMISRFDLSIDGTIEMDFGYSSGNLEISSFRTAMSSAHRNFRNLTYPVYRSFAEEAPNDYFYFPTTEGRVIQVNSIDSLQLETRFTKFNQEYENSGAFISDHSQYRKLYYGPLDNSKSITLKSLSFSKGMDFTVR